MEKVKVLLSFDKDDLEFVDAIAEGEKMTRSKTIMHIIRKLNRANPFKDSYGTLIYDKYRQGAATYSLENMAVILEANPDLKDAQHYFNKVVIKGAYEQANKVAKRASTLGTTVDGVPMSDNMAAFMSGLKKKQEQKMEETGQEFDQDGNIIPND